MKINHKTFQQAYQNRMRLLISCQDQEGIVAEVTRFLHQYGANIVQSDQYSTDPFGGNFFMRIEFELPGSERGRLQREFEKVAQPFQMKWRFSSVSRLKRIAIFVSKMDHCLLELLWRVQAGDIIADIVCVTSNHPDLCDTVESFNIPFHYIPVNQDHKSDAEAKQQELLKGYQTDVVVLARYMQILSADFVAHYPSAIINIHHSFLPAFMGARPYERAYERGVKMIGATSHYVTDNLDEGPIIAQGVNAVSHRDQVEDLKRVGRTIERNVLADAVSLHLKDRIIVDHHKTIVF